MTELDFTDGGKVFTAVMPAGRNRWFVIGALIFGIPWLVGYFVLAGVVFVRAGDPWRGTLIVFMLTLLTVLIDVVAAASIWGALYALTGRETLVGEEERISLRRTAAGITIPFRAKRGILDRVEPLVKRTPGRDLPYPRLEFRGARTSLRFGAGLTAEEAEVLRIALTQYLARTGVTTADRAAAD